MRITYNKETKIVVAIIPERFTSHIPPSHVGEGSTYIDFDYDDSALDKSPLALALEIEGDALLGKVIVFKGINTYFEEPPTRTQFKTVLINVNEPKFHKDVAIYTKKAEEMGASVQIEDIDSAIMVKIKHETREVGSIFLTKRGCCTYVYDRGEVIDREFFPHYFGFSRITEYLRENKRASWIDLNGFVKTDEELNRFKRKFGEIKSIVAD